MASPVAKLVKGVKRRVRAVAYGSPIYQMVLEQGPLPPRFAVLIPDKWPGDAKLGQTLIGGSESLFDDRISSMSLAGGKWQPFSSHSWLRDLRAVGTNPARKRARELLNQWLDENDHWNEAEWSPEVLGERVANWIGFHDFYNPDNVDVYDPALASKLAASATRQTRHLLRMLPDGLTGMDDFGALRGAIYACLCLEGEDRALGFAMDVLRRKMANEILQDGGHVSRDPLQHVRALRHLIDIRAALRTAGVKAQRHDEDLTMAIGRMVPAMKFFRHGDGFLALFNGGCEGDNIEIDAILSASETKGRALRRLPATGYERVIAGRSLLLIDIGMPPQKPYDAMAHAGLLSFEFSSGRERLIVNCGHPRVRGQPDEKDWGKAMAATAAHTALTVADTNACEVMADATGIGRRAAVMNVQRYEQNGASCVEAVHDGYLNRFRIVHRRQIELSAQGDELKGTEELSGGNAVDFALRWHIHPSVQVSLLHGGKAALLRTPSGIGWKLRVEGGELGLESSIYCGGRHPRRSMQLKAGGITRKTRASIVKWSLTRERPAGG